MPCVLAATWLLPIDAPPIRDGALVVEGERIAWVGRRVELPDEYRVARVTAFPDSILLPGLVNAHCHTHLTAALGRLPGTADRFDEWLRSVIAEQAQWTAQIPRLSTRAGLDLMATRGITTVGDMVRDPELSVYTEAPLRSLLFLELIGFPAERAGVLDDWARRWLDRFDLELGDDPRFRAGLGPHAPYTVSPDLMRRLAALALEREMPIAIHLAETRQELQFLQNGTGGFEKLLNERRAWDDTWKPPGVSPVRLAADLGLLDLRGSAIHLNYLTDDDIALVKRGRLTPVWCPGAHRFFGHADHPTERLLAAGVDVALGTDSLASNTQLDMVAEMRLAARAFPEVDPSVWVKAGTLTAARALAWEDEIGSLTAGKAADLVMFTCERDTGPDPYRALLEIPLKPEVTMFGGRELRRKPPEARGAGI